MILVIIAGVCIAIAALALLLCKAAEEADENENGNRIIHGRDDPDGE